MQNKKDQTNGHKRTDYFVPSKNKYIKEFIKMLPPIDEDIKSFLLENQEELLHFRNQYQDRREELERWVSDNEARIAYSNAGSCMHRGYYCPSPIEDLVIGNINRGKLLKRKTDKTKDFFEYSFDASGSLLRSRWYTKDFGLYATEFILRDGDIEYGIEFYDRDEVHGLCKVVYSNGRILSYFTLRIFCHIHFEKYYYQDNRIIAADFCYDADIYNNLFRMDVYRFQHGEDGRISGYTVGNSSYVFPVIYKAERSSITKRKINLSNEIIKCFKPVISGWNEPDIYAISFFCRYQQGDPTMPVVTLGYNTERQVSEQLSQASSALEARWNYAFWLQNEAAIFGEGESAKTVDQWVAQQKLSEEEDEEAANRFWEVLVGVVQELHKSRLIQNHFGKDIPILIHELEYYDRIIDCNKRANGEELLGDFLAFYDF